jgi:hypothetical protein
MAKLKTIYKIRAEIPTRVVEQSGLLSKAHEIGLNLKPDDAGNVEGAWDASLLTLAAVLKTLQEAGVQNPLIQRRVITLTVSLEASKTRELTGILRESGVSDISQAEDVFSGESVVRGIVTCEDAELLVKRIRGLGITKVSATESYEVFATS